MLNSMRRTAKTSFMKVFLLLIVASFALWGIGDMFRATQSDTAVTVGDISISNGRIQQAYEARVAAIRQQNDGEIPAFFLGLIQQGVMQELVQQVQLEQFINDQHILVDDATVARALKDNEIFHEDGAFSEERFKRIMQASNLRIADYEQSLREQLAMDALQEAWLATTPDVEQQARLIYKLEHSSVSVNALHLPLKSITNIPEPEEHELADYYEEYKDDFAAPEYRSFDLLIMTRNEVVEDTKASDDALKAYYEQNQDQFEAPPRLDLEQLIIKDKDTAIALADNLRDGTSLQDARAEDESLPENWQLMEDMTEELLPPQAYQLLSTASEPGDIVGPFESAFGQHIFRLKQVKEAGVRPFDEVKAGIRVMVEQEMQDDAIHQTITAFEDKLAGGESLKAASESLGWEVVRINAIDQDGTTQHGRVPEQLDNEEVKDALVSELFQLEAGHNITLKHWPDGTMTAMSLAEVIESRTRALDEVRGAVTASWKEDKSLELLQEKADGLVSAFDDGKSLSSLASTHGLSKPESFSFKRKDASHDVLPPLCMRLAFFAKEGELADHCDDGEGGVWLMEVTESTIADAPSDADLASTRTRIERQIREEMLQQFYGYLNTLYPVRFATSEEPEATGS